MTAKLHFTYADVRYSECNLNINDKNSRIFFSQHGRFQADAITEANGF